MARKTSLYTVTDDGRDKGKTFLITEMSAAAAERWAMRALHCMARSGVDIPEDAMYGGIATVAIIGLRGMLSAPFDEVTELLDEMMTCVKITADKAPPGRMITEDDIEEPLTRLRLRDEVLSLHTGFSIAAVLSTAAARLSQASSGSSIETSPTPLEPSSQAD